MHDGRERVAHLAVQKNIQLDQLALFIARDLIVKARIPLGARLELVEKVIDDLVERKPVLQAHAACVEIGHVLVDAPLILAQLHDGTDVFGRGVDLRLDDGLFHIVDIGGRREVGRVVHIEALAVGLMNEVGDGGRRRDDVEIEFALDALLHDLHMQQPQKAAAEAKPERDGVVRLKGERRVVELEL